MLKTTLLLVICFALPIQGREAVPDVKRLDGSLIGPAEIDATVTRLMRAAEVTGVSIAILNDGNIAYLKAYGFRDKEKSLLLTEDSVMTAASFTKSTFAYLVMQLVAEKVLDLDKPVYQYLARPLRRYPKYRDLTNDSRYQNITARMLLSHTSGFANWRAFEPDGKLQIHFEPGSKYAYSGEGITLLQLVVEEITKQPLKTLMDTRVFKPLGMTRTSMVWEEPFNSDYANGYDEYGRSLGPQRRPRADAAGSMQTTPRDFARFMLAMMQGQELKGESRDLMFSPQIQILSKRQFPTLSTETTDIYRSIKLSYGLGWGLYWSPYGRAFFKEGHDDGWRNYTVCFDKAKKGIVIMTNSSNGEGIFKELLEVLLLNTFTPIEWEGYTPYTQLPPREPLVARKEIAVDIKVLDSYAGRYGKAPNRLLTIKRQGAHLFFQENDGAARELFAESERKFFAKDNDDEVIFEVGKGGRVTRLILQTQGNDIPLKRVK